MSIEILELKKYTTYTIYIGTYVFYVSRYMFNITVLGKISYLIIMLLYYYLALTCAL